MQGRAQFGLTELVSRNEIDHYVIELARRLTDVARHAGCNDATLQALDELNEAITDVMQDQQARAIRKEIARQEGQRTTMRRIVAIIITALALAAPAAAQENNPCQAPNTQATDPNTFYVLSDQLSTPAVTSVTLLITQGEGNEPVERITVAAASLQQTGFFGCVKGSYSPAPHLLRDGRTIYNAAVRLEHSAGFVSPWSGKTPFVLSAPVVEPLRAPTLRLGRTEE